MRRTRLIFPFLRPVCLAAVGVGAAACSPEAPLPETGHTRPASLTRSGMTPSATPDLRARPTGALVAPAELAPPPDSRLHGRRPERPPTLSVEADAVPDIGRVPLRVRFEAHVDAGGDDFSCEWDFGDGARGTGPVVEHTYTAPGSYVARLLVTVASGATATRDVGIQADPVFEAWTEGETEGME